MSDPKDRYHSEAATPPPTGEASASLSKQAGPATHIPVPDLGEAPTILEGALPPLPRQNPPATAPSIGSSPSVSLLRGGTVLGNRYEILQILGEGGMGAVYKARDIELDRIIALKVIRPELASSPEILQRFKQELILARQVTDRNVIRIFDLGEADKIRFITMEYVEGESLFQILRRRGKVPVSEAVAIMKQMLTGLQAAHREGIIHRDLKPGNIMRDAQGRIVVMDFGLARSFGGDNMTRTGAMLGTVEYMSPEQAQAKGLDIRSDLFTAGLICYELLTGQTPYQADSVIASLLRRVQERAVPASDFDKTIPEPITRILSKCLERDPAARYQNVGEILRDLEIWESGGAAATLRFPDVRTWGQGIWSWIGVSVVVLVLATVAIMYRHSLFSGTSAVVGPQMSLAIVPFRNATGDTSLDWLGVTSAEMLRSDIGQSASLRTIPTDRVNQVLHDLRVQPDNTLAPDTLKRIAEFTSADRLLWGQYLQLGGQIRIEATLQDLKQQRTFTLKAEAGSEKDLPKTLQQLADSVAEKLSLPPDVIRELHAKSLKPSSESVQALRHYDEGLSLVRQGKHVEAQRSFQAAVQEDPNFALAYAKLGLTYTNLGYGNEAEQAARKAVDLSQNLPTLEKLLVGAIHDQAANDTPGALTNYENLAKAIPDDPDVQFALAGLYTTQGSFDKARAYYDKLLARDPKYMEALYGRGGVEVSAGNSQGALEYLNRALALSIDAANSAEQARLLYALGVAYSQIGKPEEALRNYQNAIGIQKQLGSKRDLAMTLNGMGQIQDSLDQSNDALKSFTEALRLRRELGDKTGIGDTLIDLSNFYQTRGHNEQALEGLRESLRIQREVGNQAYEALCLTNIGVNYADEGRYEDALIYLTQGAELRDKLKDPGEMADSDFALAETLTKLGQYEQALPRYMKALELWRSLNDKRHEAYASYGLGTLFENQGRLSAALDARQDALKVVREAQDRIATAQMLGGYGNSLALLGRGEEADKSLVDAVNLAREVKSFPLQGQNLNFQGDSAFYEGKFGEASQYYHQALDAALRTTDRRLTLVSKFNLAKLEIKQGKVRGPADALRVLAAQADTAGLKYLSIESSLYLGEALIASKDYAKAREEVNRALARSDKLGMKVLQVKSRYLLATALRLSGQPGEAARHYGEAHRILEGMRQETKSDTFLKRSDLSAIFAESAKWSQVPSA